MHTTDDSDATDDSDTTEGLDKDDDERRYTAKRQNTDKSLILKRKKNQEYSKFRHKNKSVCHH